MYTCSDFHAYARNHYPHRPTPECEKYENLRNHTSPCARTNMFFWLGGQAGKQAGMHTNKLRHDGRGFAESAEMRRHTPCSPSHPKKMRRLKPNIGIGPNPPHIWKGNGGAAKNRDIAPTQCHNMGAQPFLRNRTFDVARNRTICLVMYWRRRARLRSPRIPRSNVSAPPYQHPNGDAVAWEKHTNHGKVFVMFASHTHQHTSTQTFLWRTPGAPSLVSEPKSVWDAHL